MRRMRRRSYRYVPRLALHRLRRWVAPGGLHEACAREDEDCARNAHSRHYGHHVLGADTPPCCRGRIVETLGAVAAAFDASGIPWFAFWGTFLGAVRHGGVIPWDRDADVVVHESQRAAAIGVLRALAARPPGYALGPPSTAAVDVDLALDREPGTLRLQISPRNRIGVDVEFWRTEGSAWIHTGPGGTTRIPRRWLAPLRLWDFDGLRLPAPASVHALRHLYGPHALEEAVRREQRFGRTRLTLPPSGLHMAPARPPVAAPTTHAV